MQTQPRPRQIAGFTLIEVALAMAVVVIGVLAVFALITTGLTESGSAVAETNAALFADSVFNALGQRSQQAARLGVNTNSQVVYWREFWYGFGTNGVVPSYTVTLAAAPTWLSPPAIVGDGSINKVWLASRPQHADTQGGITNYAFRYKISVSPLPTPITSTPNTNVTVTLLVWDGAYGSTDPNDAQRFYSEFDDPGDL